MDKRDHLRGNGGMKLSPFVDSMVVYIGNPKKDFMKMCENR